MLNQNDQERFMRLWTANQPAVANYVHSLIRVALQRIRTQLRECVERKLQLEGGMP